jgi:hypothetical protein
MHPDDPFHIIIDALRTVSRMSPEELAAHNDGRPPWDWYDDLGDSGDPKTSQEGFARTIEEALRFAFQVLDNGDSREVLEVASGYLIGIKRHYGDPNPDLPQTWRPQP